MDAADEAPSEYGAWGGMRAFAIGVLAFGYWMLYENVVFFYPLDFGGPRFALILNVLKAAVPFVLLALSPKIRVRTFDSIRGYILWFALFVLWLVVPTAISGSMVEWFKLLPRVVGFVAMVAAVGEDFAVAQVFIGCMVLYCVSAFLQYVALYTPLADGARFHGIVAMAGPYGLLGNVSSEMIIGDRWFLRLCGFWNEPSNAAGSCCASAFLARFLAVHRRERLWNVAAAMCASAGFATLANAGYLSFGVALLFGAFVRPMAWLGATTRTTAFRSVAVVLAIAMLALALVGRSYVATHAPDSLLARAVTGVREVDGIRKDITDGRATLAGQAFATALSSIGAGVQVVGTGGIDASATAPLFWLALGGFPAFALLALREMALWRRAVALVRSTRKALYLVQALVVVVVQQAIFGSWMNPNYLFLAAIVLCSDDYLSVGARGTVGRT